MSGNCEDELWLTAPDCVRTKVLDAVRVLPVDGRSFLSRVQEDPTLAFRLLETLSLWIDELVQDVSALSRALRDCMGERLG